MNRRSLFSRLASAIAAVFVARKVKAENKIDLFDDAGYMTSINEIREPIAEVLTLSASGYRWVVRFQFKSVDGDTAFERAYKFCQKFSLLRKENETWRVTYQWDDNIRKELPNVFHSGADASYFTRYGVMIRQDGQGFSPFYWNDSELMIHKMPKFGLK